MYCHIVVIDEEYVVMDQAFDSLSVDQDVKHGNYAYRNYMKAKRMFVKRESAKWFIGVSRNCD